MGFYGTILCENCTFTFSSFGARIHLPKQGRESSIEILQFALTIAAVWQDVKTDRISNRLILSGMAGGLLYQIFQNGLGGFASFLCSIMIPVILLYPLFSFRVIGAGDIKLFAMVGTYLSIASLFWWMVLSFITGAVISLFVMIYRQIFWERLHDLAEYLRYSVMIFPNQILYHEFSLQEGVQNRIHFSIPMALGFILLKTVIQKGGL